MIFNIIIVRTHIFYIQMHILYIEIYIYINVGVRVHNMFRSAELIKYGCALQPHNITTEIMFSGFYEKDKKIRL